MLFDSHAHLAWCLDKQAAFASEAERICPAQAYLAVSTTLKDSELTAVLAQRFPWIHAAVGVHPWAIDPTLPPPSVAMNDLAKLIQSYPLTAIGEIGLDKSIIARVPLDQQLTWFEQQLQLALEYHLPVSIHCYKAWNEMLRLFQSSEYKQVRGVMHGFSGGAQMAKAFVALGLGLGVGPTFLKANARRYHQMVETVGVQHLVIESDAQPRPWDKACQQQLGCLSQLTHSIAERLGACPRQIEAQLWHNSLFYFALGDADG